MPNQKFVFDLESGSEREKSLAFIQERGLSADEAQELLDISLELSHKIVVTPTLSDADTTIKNQLPMFLVSFLGPKFNRAERVALLKNFPDDGMINLENFWDFTTKEIMARFKDALPLILTDLLKGTPQQQSKSKISYFVTCPNDATTEEEFDKLISALNTIPGVGVEKDVINPSKIMLFYDRSPVRPELHVFKGGLSWQLKSKLTTNNLLELVIDRVDNITVSLIKDVARSFGMRVFSPELNVFLPENPNLYDIYSGFLKPEVMQVLDKKGYKPVFIFYDSYGCYCQKKSGGDALYFINGFLLEYLSTNKHHFDSPEFAYKVADNLEDFVTKFDVNLIPIKFYQYYKKSFKIINLSYFDLSSIDRKVFVKPYILGLRKQNQSFYTVGGEDGGSLILMTKILKGETLDDTLKRFIKDDLKLDCAYVGAVVNSFIEFDLDKEQNLTPRLQVRVYLDEEQITPQVKERLERGWKHHK